MGVLAAEYDTVDGRLDRNTVFHRVHLHHYTAIDAVISLNPGGHRAARRRNFLGGSLSGEILYHRIQRRELRLGDRVIGIVGNRYKHRLRQYRIQLRHEQDLLPQGVFNGYRRLRPAAVIQPNRRWLTADQTAQRPAVLLSVSPVFAGILHAGIHKQDIAVFPHRSIRRQRTALLPEQLLERLPQRLVFQLCNPGPRIRRSGLIAFRQHRINLRRIRNAVRAGILQCDYAAVVQVVAANKIHAQRRRIIDRAAVEGIALIGTLPHRCIPRTRVTAYPVGTHRSITDGRPAQFFGCCLHLSIILHIRRQPLQRLLLSGRGLHLPAGEPGRLRHIDHT